MLAHTEGTQNNILEFIPLGLHFTKRRYYRMVHTGKWLNKIYVYNIKCYFHIMERGRLLSMERGRLLCSELEMSQKKKKPSS